MANLGNGQIFLVEGAFKNRPLSVGDLSHEMGHKFGIAYRTGMEKIFGADPIGNAISDIEINTSIIALRNGRVKEGRDWNQTEVRPGFAGAKIGEMSIQRTSYDKLRTGASRFARKP